MLFYIFGLQVHQLVLQLIVQYFELALFSGQPLVFLLDLVEFVFDLLHNELVVLHVYNGHELSVQTPPFPLLERVGDAHILLDAFDGRVLYALFVCLFNGQIAATVSLQLHDQIVDFLVAFVLQFG